MGSEAEGPNWNQNRQGWLGAVRTETDALVLEGCIVAAHSAANMKGIAVLVACYMTVRKCCNRKLLNDGLVLQTAEELGT